MPKAEVTALTNSELRSCRPKSHEPSAAVVPITSRKFCRLTSVGMGIGSIENAWLGVRAILSTHSTG